MPHRIEVVGQRFGKLIVRANGDSVNGRRRVICDCDCGNTITCQPRYLGRHTNSCGCLQREIVAAAGRQRIKHGMARKDHATRPPEYRNWNQMKRRCENADHPKYALYGGRGISVCDRWARDFSAFLADMGPRPTHKHSLDRYPDTNGNYEPGNCRWATPKEQSRNKRNHRLVEYAGRIMPLSEACELAGVNYRSALYRLNHGQPFQYLPEPPQ